MKYIQFYLGTFGAVKKTLCSEYLVISCISLQNILQKLV